MTCPELDELIDFYHGHAGPAVEAHLKGCPSCRADLETLIALPLLWGLEVEVPDRLVQSVLERLPAETQDPEARVTWGQRLGTGVLGTLTGGITILVTGSPGSTNLSAALVLSLMAGILAGIPHGARLDVADAFGRE